MKFFETFRGKKPPEAQPMAIVTPAEPQCDELEILQVECDSRRTEIGQLENEVRLVDTQLTELGQLAATLKVALTEPGGAPANASARLDQIDFQELRLRRFRDGLLTQIQTGRDLMHPLVERQVELSNQRDLHRQDKFVVELQKSADAEFEALATYWRAACESAFGLMTALGTLPGGFDAEHIGRIRSLRNDVQRRLRLLQLERVNQRWLTKDPGLFPSLEVFPAKPRPSASVVEAAS